MDNDQLRVAAILSALAGLVLGVMLFVAAVNATEDDAVLLPTPFPTATTTTPLLPTTSLATATSRFVPTLTATTSADLVQPTKTPQPLPLLTGVPTESPFPLPETTNTLPPLPTVVPQSADWVIVIGGYDSLETAQADVVLFNAAGYEPSIFLRKGQFRAAIVGYASIDSAREPLGTIRESLRGSAYLRDLRVWCVDAVDEGDYLVCP